MSRGEHDRPRRRLGQAVVDVMGRQEPKAAVPLLSVVPGEEDVAVPPGVLDRAEPVREGRSELSVLNWASENGVLLETWDRPA